MKHQVNSREAIPYKILKVVEKIARGHHLHRNQWVGIKEIFSGNSVIDVSPTGSGKTVIAVAGLLYGLRNKKVSVYLVPTSTLRDLKYEQINQVVNEIYGRKAPLIIG